MEILNRTEPNTWSLENRNYIPFVSGVEHLPENEAEDIQAVADMINAIQRAQWNCHRHAFSGTHARTQGLVKGVLKVPDDLPKHLKQGMFANGGEYPDRIPQPRSFAMKVFGVEGEMFDDGKECPTQVIEFNSTPALDLADAKTTREIIDLRIKYGNNQPELYKHLEARNDTDLQKFRDTVRNTHLESIRQYSQTAYRFGEYVAKYSLIPCTETQRKLYEETVKPGEHESDILSKWLSNFHENHDAEYELQFQLLENIEDQPVEYVGKVWNPEKYPWQTVARLRIPKQDSFNYELKSFWEDHMRVDPWHGLKALQPLGSSNRLRRVVYPASSVLRRRMNGRKEIHVKSIDDLPDILKGIIQANRYSNLITSIPQNVIEDLETDEADAGLFVCQILNGDFPQAFEQIGSEIVGEVESDFASLTSFILSLPTLAPEILNDLEQDGENVVSVIGELFTNPGAAITVIIGDVETVVQDVWGDIETVGGHILCFFGMDCPSTAAATVVNTAAMMLSSTCQGILAAAPTVTTTAGAAQTTTPASPVTTASATQPTTITTPPSAASTGPGAAACSSAEYFTSYCESISEGFDNLPQSQQASCLCYTAYPSAAWAPQIFDGYVSDCAQYLPATDPNQAVFQSLEGFCADAGNIYTMTTLAAQPTTLESPPSITPTPTFTPPVGGGAIPTTQRVLTTARASASTTPAAVQTQSAGAADPGVGLLWLWIAPLGAVFGVMLTL
ncbi:hypothetical protein MMC11_006293 [Xylographa trunciseda]|nr:hypothetical protein [Xylographa trunciseda]